MIWTGAVFLLWSAVLLLWLIPAHVSVPSSVESRFLSPRFWPTVVAGATGLVAVLTLIWGLRRPAGVGSAAVGRDGPATGGTECERVAAAPEVREGARFVRFLLVAALLIAYGWSIEPLGVVMATAGFVALASGLVLRRLSMGVLLWCVFLPIALAWFFRAFIGVLFPIWPAIGG